LTLPANSKEEPLCIYVYPGERLHKGLHGHYS
jgi:hypothetical protein